MKHLFFVHSHITWLISMGVIHHERLPAESVRFVTSRGYTVPDPTCPQSPFPVSEINIASRNPLVRIREAGTLRRFVNGLTGGGEHVWYLPQTSFSFFQELIRNTRCNGFSVLEEGVGSYHRKGDIDARLNRRTASASWIGRLKRTLWPGRRLEFVDSRYLHVYACTEEAFPEYPRKVTVRLPSVTMPSSAGIRTVIVFDAVLEYGWGNPVAFTRCLDQLLFRLAQKTPGGPVHFKLHPKQYVDDRHTKLLRQQLTHNPYGLQMLELPPDFALEQLAVAGSADFYIFFSSVGIYASLFGCRVYSLAKRLAELDEGYVHVLANIPERVRARFEYI